jgi:cell division transport system ATP-binding protein
LSFKSIQDYRRQIGIIFQDFKLLPGKDVWENIAYPLEASQEFNNKQAINKLINFVGLQGKERSFPSELSGGEQQRVAIARALVHEPKVIIADEPSGNLDRRNTEKLIKLFQKIYQEKGTTIIFATHDHFLVEKLNPRVIEIINGEITKN